MTEPVQQTAGAIDTAKLIAGGAVLVGGIVAFYMLGDQPIWLRWLLVLAAFAVGALIALQSYQGRTFWQFVQSSRVELRKVVWPSRQETWQVTLVVFVMIIILGLFFWGLDALLGLATQWLTGRGN